MIGKSLGPYEILALIGKGGMGEVYRARDPKLDREVAIKVLPLEFSQDQERVSRFEREAKLLASLDHPNIAAIHGFDTVGEGESSTSFLVLEYIEGETLDGRIKKGRLPLEETLDMGGQTARALEAAHERGVIHRDLKPANVQLRSDGTVKVLDFGLARAMEEGDAISGDSPTITREASPTMPGVILGTAGYMSPEQARGKALDKRSDIFSFGCLLFEMLAGTAVFPGETATDSIGAALHSEPDWNRLPPTTPMAIRLLLRRCLAKDPDRRLHDIADARIELEEARERVTSGTDEHTAPAVRAPRSWGWAAAAVLGVALVAVLMGRSAAGGEEEAPSVVRMELQTDLPGPQTGPSLSRDGRLLLYVDLDGGDRDIFLQRVGGENPINLTADSDGEDFSPAFSPDGDQIAFVSTREGGGIFVMGATGESPRRVSDSGFHPAWSPDGSHLVYTTEWVANPYSRLSVAQLWTVELATGDKLLLHEGDAVGPSWSPSGDRIAFWANADGQRDIWTIPAEGGDPQAIIADAHTDWSPLWSPDGRFLYFISDRGGSPDLWRVPMDQASGRATGEPDPVTTGVSFVGEASLSRDGQNIAITTVDTPSEILRFPFDPDSERTVGDPSVLHRSSTPLVQLDASPDGAWLAYGSSTPREDIYVMRSDGTGRRRLTDDRDLDRGPRWSPNGQWLVFYSNLGGSYEIWAMRPNGTERTRLTDSPGRPMSNPIWSPDGKSLLAFGIDASGNDTVSLLRLDRPIEEMDGPAPVDSLEILVSGGKFSPDGRRLAGFALNPLGSYCPAIYDLQEERLELLRDSDGSYFEALSWASTWMDEHRSAFWDLNRQSAIVWDMNTGAARELVGVPGPSELDFADDGRILYVNRFRDEADIWVLSLGER